jgi:hypothetical protein
MTMFSGWEVPVQMFSQSGYVSTKQLVSKNISLNNIQPVRIRKSVSKNIPVQFVRIRHYKISVSRNIPVHNLQSVRIRHYKIFSQ